MAPTDRESTKHPSFAVSADVVLLTTQGERLMVLLVRRGRDPFQGRWALPGGFVDIEEDLEHAALRELEEETALRLPELRQLGAYGRPDRDPRMRVVTVAFWGYITDPGEPSGGDDAAEARFWPVDQVLSEREMLAFDHHQIVSDGLTAHQAPR